MKKQPHFQSRTDFYKALNMLNKAEREAFYAAQKAAWRCGPQHYKMMEEAIMAIAVGRLKDLERSQSDRERDHERRTLVGARLPRAEAERYRTLAAAQGISLYRWCCEAFASYANICSIDGG